MILLGILISIAVLLFVVACYYVLSRYRIFECVRLRALSVASRTDSVGGVGISMLCPSPESIATVVNLLGVTYPQSEVVVAVRRGERENFVAQLTIRYRLQSTNVGEVTVCRSKCCAFRRLVVVVAERDAENSHLLQLASQEAIYNYLLVVPSSGGVLPYSLGVIADAVAEQSAGRVNVVTTMDKGVVLYSRQAWQERDERKSATTKLHINEPIVLDCYSLEEHYLLLERARYNFWEFLSLNIMRYRNKLLSLRKP